MYKIAYLCSYIPSNYLNKLGFDLIALHNYKADLKKMGREFPINMCGYVRHCKRILDNMNIDGIIFTNCCNGMQRLYDTIRIERSELFNYMLELPRDHNHNENRYFTNNIEELTNSLCQHFSVEKNGPFNLFKENETDFNDLIIHEKSIVLIGSAISPQLRQFIAQNLEQYPIVYNLCVDRENNNLPNTVLQRMPCPRSDHFSIWFREYIQRNRSNIHGIIYFGSQHCDGALFNYPIIKKMCHKMNIPIQNIEIVYRNSGFGQFSTRLEAFVESIRINSLSKSNSSKDNVARVSNTQSGKLFKKMMHVVRGVVPTQPLHAIKKIIEYQSEVFSEKVWENPEKVIWTNMVMPAELFYAADLIPVNMELVAGWLASLGLSKRYITRAEAMGFSPNVCSYHKATIGLINAGEFPIPKLAAISSHICDGGPGVINYFYNEYKTNTFTLNVPFHDTPTTFAYVCNQYKELIEWIEKYCGKKIDKQKLKHAIELSNQAKQYWQKAFEIRKGEPQYLGYLSLRNLFGTTFLFGSEAGLEVSKAFYEQLQNNDFDKSTNCKKRLLWIHFAPLYNNKVMEYLEKELNCWIVMDITGYISWPDYDPDNPIESMAKRSLSHFYLGSAEDRSNLYNRLIQEYRVDGVIHFMHNGCRAIPGSSLQIRDVADGLKVPYLELPGDCIDPRGYSDGQLRLRLEAFAETLKGGDNVFRN